MWRTNRILTDQVLVTLGAEAELLRAEARTGGDPALVRAVEARSLPGSAGLYFLADAAGNKVAGNLNQLPPEIGAAGGVFRYAPMARHSRTSGSPSSQSFGSGLHLIVGRDVEQQRRFADQMRDAYFIALGFLSLTGLLVGLVMSRLALRRIETINVATRSIMDGDLSQRIGIVGTGDEFDVLSANLNGMLARIEALMNGLREVSDNIAHDLKTPLKRLRISAEAALMDPRGTDAYRDGLENTIDEADELIKTFNSLLLIARLEAGVVEENAGRFDPGDRTRLGRALRARRGGARAGACPRHCRRQPPHCQPRAREPGGRQPRRQRHQVFRRRGRLPRRRPAPKTALSMARLATQSRSRSPTRAPAWRRRTASAHCSASCAWRRAAPRPAAASV